MKKTTKKMGAPKKKDIEKKARAKMFSSLVKILEQYTGVSNDTELAKIISPTQKDEALRKKRSMINNWKTGQSNREPAVQNFLESAAKVFFERAYQIIAEMEPIRVSSDSLKRKQKEMEFYCSKNDELNYQLENKGIYIFYDSLGKAIYAGKTEKKKHFVARNEKCI